MFERESSELLRRQGPVSVPAWNLRKPRRVTLLWIKQLRLVSSPRPSSETSPHAARPKASLPHWLQALWHRRGYGFRTEMWIDDDISQSFAFNVGLGAANLASWFHA